MNILVIDAQGGGIGRQVVAAVKAKYADACVIAVGTNSAAAASMRKAGADFSATGENAVVVNSRKADVIIGPIGIVIADSLWGEITPKMALAVGQSDAARILIPVNHCNNIIAGVGENGITDLIDDAIEKLQKFIVDNGENRR